MVYATADNQVWVTHKPNLSSASAYCRNVILAVSWVNRFEHGMVLTFHESALILMVNSMLLQRLIIVVIHLTFKSQEKAWWLPHHRASIIELHIGYVVHSCVLFSFQAYQTEVVVINR